MKHLTQAGLLFGLLFIIACGQTNATVVSTESPVVAIDDAPYVYVCNETSATVTVINANTLEVVDTVDFKALGFDKNSKPHHVAVEPDGSFWYVSLISAGKVLKFDRQNNLIDSADFETPGMLALHPKEDLIFVGRSMKAVNPPQRIGMLERSSMDMDEVDVFFPRPHGVVIDPRGDYVYTGSLSVNQFLSMNIETGDVNLNKVDGETHTFVQFALSPDGTRMVVSGQLTGKVLVFDTTDPSDIKQIKAIDVKAGPWHPAFTPDGKFVYFGNKMANTVTVLNMEKLEVEKVIEGKGLAQPHGIAISPDGKYVFISNNNQEMMMMMMGNKEKMDDEHAGHDMDKEDDEHAGHNMDKDDDEHAGHDMGMKDEKKDPEHGSMVVIDTATNEIVKVIELGFNPTGVGGQPGK